jgi:hypothetical protein
MEKTLVNRFYISKQRATLIGPFYMISNGAF